MAMTPIQFVFWFVVCCCCCWGHVGSQQVELRFSAFLTTTGASGMEFFHRNGTDYLLVSNYVSMTDEQPNTEAVSVLHHVLIMGREFHAFQKQKFKTLGAHGVEHTNGYTAFPNFMGKEVDVYKWKTNKFKPFQSLPSDGASGVEFFRMGDKLWLAVAEFHAGRAALYELDEEAENFVSRANLTAPGVASVRAVELPNSDNQVLLLTACYHASNEGGFHLESPVFVYKGDEFEKIQSVPTVGGHHVEAFTTADDRVFVFYSNDKNETTVNQQSDLYEWRDGQLVKAQSVDTEGAHGSAFFQHDERYFLAVANYGDRDAKDVIRLSPVYSLELSPGADARLELVQSLNTTSATDFESFRFADRTFLTYANDKSHRGRPALTQVWEMITKPDHDEL